MRLLNLLAIGLLARSIASALRDDGDDDDGDANDSGVSGPQPLGSQASFIHAEPPQIIAPSSPAPAAPVDTSIESVKADATNAKEAAAVAKQAAVVANKVAQHSVKVTGHAKAALKHALGALHDARVDSKGLDSDQKQSLKKAEARLREATKSADYGKLKKVKDAQDVRKEKMQKNLDKKESKGKSEKEQMKQDIQDLRNKLKEKNVDDKDIEKALDELEADIDKSDGPVNDESKAELERLRQLVDSIDAVETTTKAPIRKQKKAASGGDDGDKEEAKDEAAMEETETATVQDSDEKVTPVEEKGIDIDTAMPYGDLEPFGREDTAQELTESSIKESDSMVDQLERAEVAEEKRAVFRALTRLRGAAITSFDGVARSQTGNIDEYNKIHKWRNTHPLHHLADEESDVSKWAFPDNAD